ncbi:type VI secretion system tip protein TssI/VgrG [Pasteurella sp. PK-2025]|uniref:type VI secretion system Vgr family protein n=1 Tax=Pasteurella sp. PK-2025 TaxID=3413133 RepID=UPI003C71B5AD
MSMLKDVSSSLNQLSGIAATTKQEKLSVKLSQAERVVSQASDALNLVEGLVSGATISRLLSLFGIQSDPRGLQFTLEVQGLPASALGVLSFKLTEKYSELYCLSLKLTSLDSGIDFKSVVDNSVKFKVWQNGELLRQVNGMVVSFEQGDSGSSQTHYGMEVYPDLWRTTLRRNSRIFQQQDIQSIVSTLLTEHGIVDYAFVFRNSHPVREFCVQYQESDFDFLQRLTAEEGIFYYFEQGDGQHKVVFSDSAETLSEKVRLSYNVNRNAQLQEKVVSGFRRREQVRPSSVKLKDYTFKKPSWTAQFSRFATDIENQRAGYEHYDYPGRFKDEAQGKAFTQYRLESLRHDAHLGQGESNGPSLQVGKLLVLSHHPRAENNTAWQLIEIIHEGRQPQSAEQESGGTGTYYDNAFQVVPRHQTWRPNQRTKPRVEGPQIAMVVGPKGEEIYTDNYGRIRLQFLWDRYGHHDDHSSCWIRVTQPWAGKGWGMIAIPRVGQEVLVDFLDGDPDQPIVTGRTYHANNLPPGALPRAKTQMNLMSQTYKGGGYNGIMMDDATDGQKLDLHAQRDMNTVVLNNRTTIVKGNHSENIGNDQSLAVKKNAYKEVGQSETVSIDKNQRYSVDGIRRLLVTGNATIVSDTKITLKTAQATIVLYQNGDIDIDGENIQINGDNVFLNPKGDSKQNNAKINSQSQNMSSEASAQSSNSFAGEGEISLVSQQSSGIMDAQSKILTAQGKASIDTNKASAQALGSAAVMDISANTSDKQSGFNSKVGSLAGEAEGRFGLDGVGGKGKVEVSAVSLDGKYGGKYGSAEAGAKVFSADAEARGDIFIGAEGKYGFDTKVGVQASAISGEMKGCIGSKDSWMMVCGKVGANAGPAFDASGKVMWDNTKDVLQFGGSGKAILGAEVDIQVDFKKLKEFL